MMKFHRHAISLIAALLIATFAPKVYGQVRIAVVDLQRALNETEDGRRAKARLKKLFKQHQTELDKRQGELKTLKEDIERNKEVWSRDVLQKRAEEYQKAFIDLQQVYTDYQRELAEKEGELTGEILQRMQSILRRIGQAEGYTLIVERNEGGVMWVPSNLDVTDQVIQRYNSGEGREADGAAGGAAAGGAASGSGGAASGGSGGASSTKRPTGAAAPAGGRATKTP
jgi:outer membrane protein